MNLMTIPNQAETFNCVSGLSDHTSGIAVAIASVALGARIIEKHFILDRNLGGPDAVFSAQPEEFRAMVNAVRDVETALGTVSYELSDTTRKSRYFARSLFVVRDVKKGDLLTVENVSSIRPSYGLHPRHLTDILGRMAGEDIKKGTPLKWEFVS